MEYGDEPKHTIEGPVVTQDRTPEQLRALAEDFGCEAVFADACALQLDLDSPSLSRFERLYDFAVERGLIPEESEVETWRSKSGNWHAMIRLPKPLPPERRIMLQAMLGSDEIREMMNLVEERGGRGRIVLFRPLEPVKRPSF